VKYPRRRFPMYWWVRRKNPYRSRWIWRLRKVVIVFAFFIATLSSSYLFFIVNGNAYVMAPVNPVYHPSTADVYGVSGSPSNTAAKNKDNSKTALGASDQPDNSTSLPIAAKPSWINMPLFVNPSNSATEYGTSPGRSVVW